MVVFGTTTSAMLMSGLELGYVTTLNNGMEPWTEIADVNAGRSTRNGAGTNGTAGFSLGGYYLQVNKI